MLLKAFREGFGPVAQKQFRRFTAFVVLLRELLNPQWFERKSRPTHPKCVPSQGPGPYPVQIGTIVFFERDATSQWGITAAWNFGVREGNPCHIFAKPKEGGAKRRDTDRAVEVRSVFSPMAPSIGYFMRSFRTVST